MACQGPFFEKNTFFSKKLAFLRPNLTILPLFGQNSTKKTPQILNENFDNFGQNLGVFLPYSTQNLRTIKPKSLQKRRFLANSVSRATRTCHDPLCIDTFAPPGVGGPGGYPPPCFVRDFDKSRPKPPKIGGETPFLNASIDNFALKSGKI